ncbi:imelysin family protein [Flavobacterium sp. H122]|uniref:imelysin family protein n=1 Tax=Flavobacterium sp. H122 TaxID=2529860 RepID=UPI0010AB204D|nr:imelysin family protein [Flavobacterium sp. H122]
MKKILLLIGLLLIIIACSGGESSDTTGDNYNRTNLLTNWSDNIIIPSFENYQAKAGILKSKVESFTNAPTVDALTEVRTAWLDAYKAFQHVSLYEIGKAEEISFVSFTNVYPTNAVEIENNIANGGYNLASLTQIDKQGFPAVDYMINGLGADDEAITAFYTTNVNAVKYKQYLIDLVTKLKDTSDLITNDWKNTYRNNFIASNGNSVTSSVNKMVNVFVKNYEKNVRAGKVGIPAGVYSSGTTYSNKVEAYYKNDISKLLLNEGITATQNFFNGKHFASSTTGAGLKEYLDHLNVVKDGQKLSDIINAKFAAIFTTTAQLNDSFSEQIFSDNSKMITAFDQLQWNVIYFKTDMMPALNITVDYVDADGD